jgi:hypothetical protein
MAISTTGWKGIAALGFTAAAFVMLMGSGEPPKAESGKKNVKESGAKKGAPAPKVKEFKGEKKPLDDESHDAADDQADNDADSHSDTHSEKAPEGHDDSNEPTLDDEGTETEHAKFVVSSHTNFNVVPHGVIKFGGKGKPGDKVMVSVDGKPSMKGTIKPNGRWTFDIKIKSAGGRTLKADNLSSKESKVIKLKIK